MRRENSAAQGVEEAWAFWLSQHDVSVPEIIEESIKKAFGDWLIANEDALIVAIAEKAAAEVPWMKDVPKPPTG